MGALDNLPKSPAITDLVGVIREMEGRVAELEAYVTRNDTRITRLETYAAEVIARRGEQIDELQAANAQHQQEVDRIKADAQRIRWAMAHGRRP
jgi:uncharacterized coiled-coil protein SlyX